MYIGNRLSGLPFHFLNFLRKQRWLYQNGVVAQTVASVLIDRSITWLTDTNLRLNFG